MYSLVRNKLGTKQMKVTKDHNDLTNGQCLVYM